MSRRPYAPLLVRAARAPGLLAALLVTAGLSTGLAAGSAHAQEKKETVIQETDKTVYNKKTVIDFSEVNIEGELTKPQETYIKNRKKTKFRNLIELRGNFRPELKRSVGAL